MTTQQAQTVGGLPTRFAFVLLNECSEDEARAVWAEEVRSRGWYPVMTPLAGPVVDLEAGIVEGEYRALVPPTEGGRCAVISDSPGLFRNEACHLDAGHEGDHETKARNRWPQVTSWSEAEAGELLDRVQATLDRDDDAAAYPEGVNSSGPQPPVRRWVWDSPGWPYPHQAGVHACWVEFAPHHVVFRDADGRVVLAELATNVRRLREVVESS